jgi:hypothetical protein
MSAREVISVEARERFRRWKAAQSQPAPTKPEAPAPKPAVVVAPASALPATPEQEIRQICKIAGKSALITETFISLGMTPKQVLAELAGKR